MRKFAIAGSVAVGVAAAVLGSAAPALAAPTSGNAQTTIDSLEAEGNRVIVNRQSAASLDEASVVAITRGPDIRRLVWDSDRDMMYLKSVGQEIHVDVR